MNFIKNVYIRIFLWNWWTNWRAHQWDADTPWPALISTQWSPFSIPVKRIPRCIFGANLAILIQIHYKLPRRQAKFPRILRQNGQNYFKGQGQWPCIVIPAESIPGCTFVANLVIPAHICEELPCGQAKFPRILSQNGQCDLEGQGQWLPSCQLRVSQDACLQIRWFQLPSVMSYYVDKVKFTDGRTDGQRQAMTIHFCLKAKG